MPLVIEIITLTLREINDACFGYKVREWNHINQLRSWREDLALKCSKMFERPEYVKDNFQLPQRWLHSHLTLIQQREKALERHDFEYAQACNHQPTKHKGVQIYHMEKRGIQSYVEKKRRALSSTIQETQILEIEQPIYSNHDPRLAVEFSKRVDRFVESMRQQREQEEADHAIDDEIMQRFGHLDPDLKNGNEITPEKRAQLLKALEYSKQAEKDLELDYSREQDYERDR